MDDYAIVSMVQHGIGVSVVPEMILRDKSEGLAVRELAPCQYRRLGIAIPSLSDASPAAAALHKAGTGDSAEYKIKDYGFFVFTKEFSVKALYDLSLEVAQRAFLREVQLYAHRPEGLGVFFVCLC